MGAPQWRDACRQLLFERARSRRWKARHRLEEAKGRQAAAVHVLDLLSSTLGRYEATLH